MANYSELNTYSDGPSLLDQAFEHDPAIEHVKTPLWREVGFPLEWLQLRLKPVYHGCNVTRGNGQPVLLIPGFMAGDGTLLELHHWLERMGYSSTLSGIVFNTDCPDKTAEALVTKVQTIHRKMGQKVTLIGHSLGGMLSKYVLQRVPELIERVITLGSPFRSLVKAHPAVVGIWESLKDVQGPLVARNVKASCGTGHCTCGFVRSMLQPAIVDVPQYAIYSKKDGVVDWESCIEEDPSRNIEINCTHIGMIVHYKVYETIAEKLAE